mmetsp:Transcript_37677/g.61347  ORF Transcript_37677/g.61347 Transcript_37677/m.61347 type:complete len:116 (-) Transcript_37677:780-1127(-)
MSAELDISEITNKVNINMRLIGAEKSDSNGGGLNHEEWCQALMRRREQGISWKDIPISFFIDEVIPDSHVVSRKKRSRLTKKMPSAEAQSNRQTKRNPKNIGFWKRRGLRTCVSV